VTETRTRPTDLRTLPDLYGWPQTFESATRVSRAGQREYVLCDGNPRIGENVARDVLRLP
jgi:hypothetical protein